MVNDSLFLFSYFRNFRSRGVVQIHSSLIFEPEKVNIFNKDCQRGGKEVTCMSVTICLSLHSRTRTKAKPKVEVGEFSSKPVRSKPTCRAQLYLPSSQLWSDAAKCSTSSQLCCDPAVRTLMGTARCSMFEPATCPESLL